MYVDLSSRYCEIRVAVCCSVLYCVAVCCSVLQCCRVLQRVAVCCSALQCVAVRCSVLQCVAVWIQDLGVTVLQSLPGVAVGSLKL